MAEGKNRKGAKGRKGKNGIRHFFYCLCACLAKTGLPSGF
jgi:hypothetical protein